MKVVIASDSYKESLKAIEVCGAIERGFRAIFPNAEYVKIPIGDGGEGTVESLVDATGGRIISISVTGPHAHQLKNLHYPQVSKNVILSKKLAR
ncbi:glycerate kinase, partial [Bacillus thuringiensis]|uniref:glycerate kinase n=1 Tax=Bacillus thuringiensis TaxID=1428 RepID=UPI0028689938